MTTLRIGGNRSAMDVKALVVGSTKLPKALVPSARKSGGRLWIALPIMRDDDGGSDALVDRTAKKLGGEARVIEVEMSLGLRGEDVSATTYIAPGRQDEQDLTELAADMIDEIEGAFDEDEVALEIAWALVEALARAMHAQ
jgi:hypothetical protein